jgi:hypothetical protein
LGTVPHSKAQLLGILGDGSTSSRAAAEKASAASHAHTNGEKEVTNTVAPPKKTSAAKQATTSGDKKPAVTTTGAAAPAKKKETTATQKPSAAYAKKKAGTASAVTNKKEMAKSATTSADEKSAVTTTGAAALAKKKETTVTQKPSAADAKKKASSASAVANKKEMAKKTKTIGVEKSATTASSTETADPAKKKTTGAPKKPSTSAAAKKTGTLSTSPASMINPGQSSPTKQLVLTSMMNVNKQDPLEKDAETFATVKHKQGVLEADEAAPREKTESALVLSSSTSHAVQPPPATQTSAELQPRISKKLTLVELRDEAEARGLQDSMNLPKLKVDLLHFLVDGSIHVAESVEYKQYKSLLNRLEEERPQLYAQSLASRQAERQNEELRRQQKAEKERLAREAERTSEIQAQTSLHRHSFPLVHPHLLARTAELRVHGNPRSYESTCDLCSYVYSRGVYTCEQCDLDICYSCFEERNMTSAQRQEREKQERIKQEKRRLEEEERRAEAAAAALAWDATKQFAAETIRPSDTNKTLDAKGHKYIVWCSNGDNYCEPPYQYFDSGWETSKEANDRARYLFFWKNPWGMDPDEVGDDLNGEPEPCFREGLVNFTVHPTDYSCWTVGVVPALAFRHLPQATTDESVPERGTYGSWF